MTGCGDQCATIIPQLLVYGLGNGAVIALNALGFTLAYAVARQINLAHGNVFALSSVVVAYAAQALGVTDATPPLARVAALLVLAVVAAAVGALLNVGVERLAFRPFRSRRDPLGPLVASVALSFLLFQIAVWWHALNTPPPPPWVAHAGNRLMPVLAIPDLLPALRLGVGGVVVTLKDGVVLAIAGAVALVGAKLLRDHPGGRLLRAAAQDPELTALSGADPQRAQTLAFAAAGVLAGLAGAIYAAYYGGAFPQHGLRSGLAAMTAAVLGGVGDPRGALAAGVLLGVGGSYADFFLDPKWTPVLVLGLLVAALALRPGGIAGAVAPEPRGESAPSPARAANDAKRVWGPGPLVLVAALAYPWLDAALGWQKLPGATIALLLVALAVGLSLVVESAGLLDLGYAAFFAIGGYTAALVTSSGSRLAPFLPALFHDPWLALALGGLVAAGFGLLFGVPSVRTRGEYLAIVTLAFGEIVPGVIAQTPEWTGGARGISGVAQLRLDPWLPDPRINSYAAAAILAALGCVVALRLGASRVGRAWAAVRDDEVAAAASGVHVPGARLLAFTCGAAYAGVAGALFAAQFGYVEPAQFDFTLSLMVLSAVVIGGRWGLRGIVIGALVVAAYDRLLVDALDAASRALFGTAIDMRQQSLGIFGLALYLAILLRARPGTRSPQPASYIRTARGGLRWLVPGQLLPPLS